MHASGQGPASLRVEVRSQLDGELDVLDHRARKPCRLSEFERVEFAGTKPAFWIE